MSIRRQQQQQSTGPPHFRNIRQNGHCSSLNVLHFGPFRESLGTELLFAMMFEYLLAKISVSHMAFTLGLAIYSAGRYDHTRPYILAKYLPM